MGLKIAQDKIQCQVPWEFLGQTIWENKIMPKRSKFGDELKTLNDFHKLLGNIN